MTSRLADIVRIYQGSDGEATRALYAELEQRGPAGQIAVNLLRAAKTSERAKAYRRGFSHAAYDTKDWAIGNLLDWLTVYSAACGIRGWGWGVDQSQEKHRHVLYIDLQTGQVSFHSARRREGPDYSGTWDGARGMQADRIVRWAAAVLERGPFNMVDGSAIPATRYLCDGDRHLICLPYTVDGLHAMAAELEIGAHWFHGGRWPHYDVPKGRHAEICARPDVQVVSPREILVRIRAGLDRDRTTPAAAQGKLL
ncbi:DUF4031 domain-containing protein [uncultured Reyranella sp.]|jgi:hypothetical protein|uniref:DUF4031 domain-containing protein n=1 Tax=uncultured Reyranella sp. TaxID=735512 RepID=UPI00259C8D41|nr:DUF4031 domain-containing protein [uncultured Reyranella sp.]